MAWMTSPAGQRASRDGESPAGRSLRPKGSRLSSDGMFANGVTAAAVTQFILDYDEAARIEDVAAYFHLEVEDVAAALRYYALHGDRMRASGQVVPPR
jgi:hypothetical protein